MVTERVQLSASLLAADYGMMRAALMDAEAAGVDRFHFDFMDGHYVPNLALSPDHIRALHPHSGLPFDVHLELSNPDEALEMMSWQAVSTLIFQADTLTSPLETFKKARGRGLHIGLSIHPDWPLAPVEPLLPYVDQCLVLGVRPGFGGQPMHPETIDRLERVARMAADLSVEIAVDGGVNQSNCVDVAAAGADVLVVGTAIFGAPNLQAAVTSFRTLLAAR
ncbi:MAG: ribulose-phosphate 3-epimerase [Anaerolineales bacterium]|jgi:ribulose-phosphate 3-epimerase